VDLEDLGAQTRIVSIRTGRDCEIHCLYHVRTSHKASSVNSELLPLLYTFTFG
jgi:hypothetical protein